MTLKGRFIFACAAITLTLGIAGSPVAFAQGQSAHALSAPMRHQPMMHRPMMHRHMMMHHHRRMMHKGM